MCAVPQIARFTPDGKIAHNRGMPEVSMPIPNRAARAPALAALYADADARCLSRFVGVAGTHALLLDAAGGSAPRPLPGLGRWTMLRWSGTADGWRGEVHAGHELPFADDSFCLVWMRGVGGCVAAATELAVEAARVLAPHGLLLAVELHPWSLWRPWLPGARSRDASIPQPFAPVHWSRALRAAGMRVAAPTRCGAPWPRSRGAQGLPAWLAHGGGAYLLEAHKRDRAGVVLRLRTGAAQKSAAAATLAPRAQRMRA